MTAATEPPIAAPGAARGAGRILPVLSVAAALIIVWYGAAVLLNAPVVRDAWERGGVAERGPAALVAATLAMERPVLPAPHQVVAELHRTTLEVAPTSKRSLVHHAWVTVSAALLGFALGTALGILLAVGIVHVRTLDRALLPWIIASQTIPILAIAPMIVVVLGALGLTGLLPKAIISMYLCFFPVTISMVKGLRAPEPIQLELLRTWSASRWQVFRHLRWPASLPFLLTGLKIAIAISLVGAIVGELPTGAQAGLGARLLTGSYYGQTVQIWAALVMASLIAALLVGAIGLVERRVLRRREPV